MVGSRHGTSNIDDVYIFHQRPKTFVVNTKMYLQEPFKLKELWHGLPSIIDQKMFMVRDAQSNYIFALKNGKSVFLDLENDKLIKSAIIDECNEYFQRYLLLSSNEPYTSYSMWETYVQIERHHFSDKNVTQATVIGASTFSRICAADNGKVVAEDAYTHFGKYRIVNWNIQAGFIDDKSVVLFEKNGSVISFPKSAFGTKGFGSPVPVTIVSGKDFWKKWVPPFKTKTSKYLHRFVVVEF